MYARITIPLRVEEIQALRRWAEAEWRDPKTQLEKIVHEALAASGYLQPTPQTQPAPLEAVHP